MTTVDHKAVAAELDRAGAPDYLAESASIPAGTNQSGVTRILDGPAAGAHLLLRRAPLYLRVTVEDTLEEQGKVDALDQEEDEPSATEVVYAYKRVGEPGVVWLRPGGRYVGGDYEHRPDLEHPSIRSREGFMATVRDREGLQ